MATADRIIKEADEAGWNITCHVSSNHSSARIHVASAFYFEQRDGTQLALDSPHVKMDSAFGYSIAVGPGVLRMHGKDFPSLTADDLRDVRASALARDQVEAVRTLDAALAKLAEPPPRTMLGRKLHDLGHRLSSLLP